MTSGNLLLMTARDELPPFGYEHTLQDEQVAFLRDRILFPSVDFLARRNIMYDSAPESEFQLGQKLVGIGGITKASLEATVWLDYGDADDPYDMPQRAANVMLAVMSARLDMVDCLVRAAKHGDEDRYIPGEDEGTLIAWEVCEYQFPDANQHDRPRKYKYHELEDTRDAETVWDDQEGCDDIPRDDDVLSDKQKEILEALEDETDRLSSNDPRMIKIGLIVLGVPEEDLIAFDELIL